MALQGWEQEKHKVQQENKLVRQENKLLKSLMIRAMADPLPPPGEDTRQRPNPNQPPSSPYLPGKSPHKLASLKLAHGKFFDEYGQPIQDPAKGMLPSGKLIHMKHMEQSPEEHKRNKEMHIKNYGQQARATSRQIRDRLKRFTKGKGYDDSGGSLRGIPDSLRIQLLRDAMAQNLPANNIRRLQESGHQLVIDDENPNRLKIIKQFRPPRA